MLETPERVLPTAATPAAEKSEITEIISPVKPKKPWEQLGHPKSWPLLVLSAILLFIVAVIYHRVQDTKHNVIPISPNPITWSTPAKFLPKSRQIKPEPKISSTSTTTPQVVMRENSEKPKSKTAAATQNVKSIPGKTKPTTSTPPTIYTSQVDGFSVRLPTGGSARTDELSGRTQIYNAAGKLAMTIIVLPYALETGNQLENQLRLSPQISELQNVKGVNYFGYRYLEGDHSGEALVKNGKIYYITDLTGQLMSSIQLL